MPDNSPNQNFKHWIRHEAASGTAEPWYCSHRFRLAALLVMALFVGGEGVVGIFFRDNDFEVHRNVGQLFLEKNLYQNYVIQYPPARIMLNALPALLPYRLSRAVFYILSLAALGWTLVAWRRLADRGNLCSGAFAFAAAAFTLIVSVTYIQRDLDDCGLQLFLLFFLTAALVALEAGKTLRCGAWLGLAAIYKLTPLLFFPYLCWKRQWRAAASMAIFMVAWSLAPAIWIGWDGNVKAHANWLTCISSCLGSTDPAENHIEPPNHRNQSLMMALTRLVQTYPPGHPLYLDHPLFVEFGDLDPELAKKVVLGVLFLLAAVLAWRCRRPYRPSASNSGILPEWAGLMLLAAILSPICWLQHMVLVIPTVYLLVCAAMKPGGMSSWKRCLFFLVAIIMIFAGQRDLLGHGLFMVLMSYKVHAWGALLALGLVLTLRENRADMVFGKTHKRVGALADDLETLRLHQ